MGRISYLLDSNILSEPARLKPNAHVLQQFSNYDDCYATAALVWHELVYGCELLPASKKRATSGLFRYAVDEWFNYFAL